MRNLITNIETKTLQDAAAANGNGILFDITGLSAVVLQVLISGVGTTKVNFEVSIDNTTWTAIKGTNILTVTKVASTIDSGLFHFSIGALLKFRARISDTISVVSVTVLGTGISTSAGELSAEIASILGIIAKGQATMANSLPIVVASDQNDINVDVPNNLLGITTKGQAVMANSLPVTLASDETDPIVTALQIIDNMISGNEAQVDVVTSALPTGAATEATLAAQSAKLPATLGQKASAASLSAVLSTEQEAIQTAIKIVYRRILKCQSET